MSIQPIFTDSKEEASCLINAEQLQNLISGISQTNPPVLSLPSGKNFTDIQKIVIQVRNISTPEQDPTAPVGSATILFK
jgi:hypothetical protein